MRTLAALLSIGVVLAAGCSSHTPEAPPPAAAGPFKAVASVMELMRGITIPNSNAIFAAQGEAPQDEAGWLAVQNNAVLVAESGNLLMIGERARDADNWRKGSIALIDAATLAVSAARDKNAVKLGQAADALYMACESCHQQYLPK